DKACRESHPEATITERPRHRALAGLCDALAQALKIRVAMLRADPFSLVLDHLPPRVALSAHRADLRAVVDRGRTHEDRRAAGRRGNLSGMSDLPRSGRRPCLPWFASQNESDGRQRRLPPRAILSFLTCVLTLTACGKRETPVQAGLRTHTLLVGNAAEPADLD